ncbi:MAG: YiiX family permuted papain-like enzyme [Azonexus sp.]
MSGRRVFAVLLGLLLVVGGSRADGPAWRDGDIVFQTSRSTQSLAVQKATGSPYSHMGMVFMRGNRPYVFEAAGQVQYTPLSSWLARGIGGHVVVKRLRDGEARLDPSAIERLRRAAKAFEGRPYDLAFAWSDERIYCSELVWKIYQRALGIELGGLQRIREFNLGDPAVQQKVSERYGKRVPLDELAISPVAIFNSPHLLTVLER